MNREEIREKIVTILFALSTEPAFIYAAWRCSGSESPDIVGLADMPQLQSAVNQILKYLDENDVVIDDPKLGYVQRLIDA